jgi:hypothetical protein
MGVLPHRGGRGTDSSFSYSSAKVVLGTTEGAQQRFGMINNRVFEVLACGAPLVMDGFAELRNTLEGHVSYADTPHAARVQVKGLLANESRRAEMGQAGRALVVRHHTYAHRVETIIAFYQRLVEGTGPEGRGRSNAPSVGLVYAAETMDWNLFWGLLPALTALEDQGHLRVKTFAVSSPGNFEASCREVDLVLLRTSLGEPLESSFRSFPCRARKGILLRGQASKGVQHEAQHLLKYDVVGHDGPPPEVVGQQHPNMVWTLGLGASHRRADSAGKRWDHVYIISGRVPPSMECPPGRSLWVSLGPGRQGPPAGCEMEVLHTPRPQAVLEVLSSAEVLHLGEGELGGLASLVLAGWWHGASVEVGEEQGAAIAGLVQEAAGTVEPHLCWGSTSCVGCDEMCSSALCQAPWRLRWRPR